MEVHNASQLEVLSRTRTSFTIYELPNWEVAVECTLRSIDPRTVRWTVSRLDRGSNFSEKCYEYDYDNSRITIIQKVVFIIFKEIPDLRNLCIVVLAESADEPRGEYLWASRIIVPAARNSSGRYRCRIFSNETNETLFGDMNLQIYCMLFILYY